MNLQPSKWGALALLVSFLALSAGCGSSSGTPTNPTPKQAISIAITPAQATVILGQTQQFTASLKNAGNTNVTWAVNQVVGGGADTGTIDKNGLYTAPSVLPNPATVTVSVTSVEDTSKSAQATVTLQAPVAVSVSPTQATVRLGRSVQFSASVQNDAQNAGVTWAVNQVAGGNANVGTIDNTGLYTAPGVMPSATVVTITATSVTDATKSANAQVTLQPDVSVAVVPATATVATGGKQAFQATVTGDSNIAVTWQVNQVAGGNDTVGTIDSSGNYTAPSALPNPATVTVTAVSQADPTASGSAQVTLEVVNVNLELAPTAASLQLAKAATATDSVNVTAPDGFTGSIQLAVTGLPANVSGSWDNSTLTGSGTATLTLTSASFSLAQTLPITISASSKDSNGNTQHQTATVNLTITGWQGQVHTLAGQPGGVGFEDGSGTVDELEAHGITAANGQLFFVDGRGKALRSLDLGSDTVSTLVGGPFSYAVPFGSAVAYDASRATWYIADTDLSSILAYQPGAGNTFIFAGTGHSGSADGTLTSASFNQPHGLALSADDNTLYVADSGNGTIRKIDLVAGMVSTVAGQAGHQSSIDGVGTSAGLDWPWGLDIDPSGQNIYFTEHWALRIRRFSLLDGTVTTLTGGPGAGPGMLDGPPGTATFRILRGLRVDPHPGANLLYFGDGNLIRALTLTATPTVVTLSGQWNSGDADGYGWKPSFFTPRDLVAVPDFIGAGSTSLFIADTDNGLVRELDIPDISAITSAAAPDEGTLDLQVKTIDGQKPHFGLVDGAGTGADFTTPSTALFDLPQGITTDGTVAYIADSSNDAIRKLDLSTGTVTTIAGGHAGSSDGVGSAANFYFPDGVELDAPRNLLYIADTANSRIRVMDLTTGMVTTIAGSSTTGWQDGVGSNAHFNHPYGMAITKDGSTLYIADVGDNAIRVLNTATDAVTTIAGPAYGWHDGVGAKAQFFDPTGLALTPDESTLYITDFNNHLIRKLDIASATVTTIAGQPNVCGYHDGIGTAATLCSPAMLATDGRSLFWGDSLTGQLRVMNLSSGQVTTLTANPGILHLQDGSLREVPGGIRSTVQCNEPFGVALAPDDSFLLITDMHGNTVRILQ